MLAPVSYTHLDVYKRQGGGFAYDDAEVIALGKNALKLSPVSEVLVEKSIKGYKEIEFEVMRDHNDTAIVICSMENIDPVGVHTCLLYTSRCV